MLDPRAAPLARPPSVAAMNRRPTPAHLALALAIVAVWGLSFVPMRWGLDEIPPFALAALRFGVAAVPAFLFVKPPAMPWPGVVGYGVAIGVFQFGLLFLGIHLGMPAGLSSLVIQTQAFFTIALAVALDGERFQRWNAIGAGVAFAGIAVLAGARIAGGASAPLLGFAAVVASGLAWGVGNIIAKRAGADHDVDAFSLVVWSSLVPPLPLAVVSWTIEGGDAVLRAVTGASWVAWASIAFMSWAATLFAWAAWNRLLHTYPTALIAPFSLLVPVFGIGASVALLGERLTVGQLAGMLLVFAGLAINVWGQTRLRRPVSGTRRS